MLQRLIIRNYAIIDAVDIDFSPRLNIITGETGAGKSIILGALGLIKGERAQTQMIRSADKKCLIEAQFDIAELALSDWFLANDIPYQQRLVIKRELNPDGKTKAYINDISCGVALLQDLGDRLIEIHSQHDSLELKSPEFQRQVVDAFADNNTLLNQMKQSYGQYKSLEREYKVLTESLSKSQAEKDLQTYQLQELNQYEFENWSVETIENEHQLAENALEIKQILGLSVDSLKLGEQNLLDALKEILARMRKFEKFSKDLGSINEQLDVSIDQLDQIARDYEHLAEQTEFDEEKLEDSRSKIAFIHTMFKKHQLHSIEDLTKLKTDLSTALSYGENLSEKIVELERQVKDSLTACRDLAQTISQRRKAILPQIENQLLAYLAELQMESSQFQIELTTDETQLSETGYDSVEFLFTANAGSPLRELKRAISGGEMSRFMLAIKSLIAQKINLPTIIFDEIDTGVSGIVANKVAGVLDKLAKNHQLIAITHLPQIASRGVHHLSVFKKTENSLTTTQIKLLHQADREIEIARMLSGETITQASLTSARELLR